MARWTQHTVPFEEVNMSALWFCRKKERLKPSQPATAEPQMPEPPEEAPCPPPDEDPLEFSGTMPHQEPPSKPSTTGPYRDSREHLWHALARVDALVRAQTVRWQHTVAGHKSEKYWGMVQVGKDEVDAFLKAPFMRPDELPPHVIRAMKPHLRAARRIAEEIEERQGQTPTDVTLRLVKLEDSFRLLSFHLDMLLVCLLPELDGRYRRLFGYLQDDASRTRPSVELVLQILQPVTPEDCIARSVFNEASPLRASHLLALSDGFAANDPLSARLLHVDTRVVNYLLGDDRADSRLKDIVARPKRSPTAGKLILEEDLLLHLLSLVRWIDGLPPDSEEIPAFFLHGNYGSGRLDAARTLCKNLDIELLVVDTQAARRSPEGWPLIVDLALREAILRGAALYWSDTEVLREQESPGKEWDFLVARVEAHRGIVFLASETPWDPAERFYHKPLIRINLPTPGYELRRLLWSALLPDMEMFAEPVPDRVQLVNSFANGFQLTGGQIADAVATAKGEARRRDPLMPRLVVEDLFEGCRRQSSRALISLARLIEPRTNLSFSDLILTRQNRRQLDELRARIRYRSQVYTGMGFERRLSMGKGLIAVFAGSSGTGKTMAAELLAREYGMQLYKVDLSAVVSKYVGETEKNLARMFKEAEDANAILLFDDGEVMFAKRGEVKEARDRWANIEASFLLQRIEEYRGVVVITTNLKQDIEPAFWRRIDMAVEFPRPEAEARFEIWRGMFPEGLERPPDEQLRTLAEQFPLSGGSIKNAVVDAAFRAMEEACTGCPEITLRHLVLGIARELQKTGKALTRGDFGEEFYAWVEKEIL